MTAITTLLGPDLFIRDARFNIGDVEIRMRPNELFSGAQPTLRTEFTVERSTNRSTNKAEATIYNLKTTTRDSLQNGQEFRIVAGYVGTAKQIFKGTVSDVEHQRQSVDWITKVQATDGGKQIQQGRINESFPPGSPIANVALSIANSTGHALGNLATKLAATQFRGNEINFRKGYVASGKTDEQFAKIMRIVGLKYSIQDGAIQVLDKRDPVLDVRIQLNRDSGLIGAPEIGKDGGLKAVSLLQGDLMPGREVLLTSDEISGSFRIERVVHAGGTFSDNWYSTIEGSAL